MQLKTIHQRKRKYFLLILLLIAVGMTKAQAQVSTWDGSWEPWTNGNGTENDPFLIENAQQLAYLAYQVNNGLDANNEYVVGYGKYYRLMTDIDLNGNESFQWTPIGLNSYSFGGCFDGNNHIISGVYINLSYANRVGFFGYTNGATILDLIISGNKISTTGLNAGGIIGIAGGLTVVSGCGNNVEYVSSDKASYVNTCSGGIVGQAEDSVSIINCYNSGSIYSHSYSSSYSGGIVGQAGNMVSVINCYNMGGVDSFSVSSYSGGIVGQVEGTSTLTNNYNIAAVSSFADSNSCSGGIIGKTEGTFSVSITNCFNTGSVSSTYNSYYSSGSSCSGGIVGQVESSVVTNSYNTGSLSSSGGTTNIGGIFGVMSNGSVDNSYYLDSCGGTNTYGGEPQTEVFMKSSEFVTILNDGSLAYQMDNQPFVNQGYPIFSGFFMHTLPVSVVTCYSATLNGDYVSGIYNIDTQGFEYKKAIDQEYTTVNYTAGQTPYSYVLNDLESGTTYQYRAFVTTDEGTAYGNLIEFTTLFLFGITAEANPAEGGIVIGAGDYQQGGTCTLTATANEDYTFMYWTENGNVVSTNTTYTFTVTTERELVANFTLPLTITASAFPEEGGTVTGAGVYNYNENCTLSAVANSDYYFVNWTKDDTVVSTQPNYSFIVTEEGNYVAHFVPKPVGIVTAMYDPEPENNQSPYIRVCWDSEPNYQENFESGDFSLFDWQLDNNHPWIITTNNPYEGNYCMKSGGAGVANVVSDMSVTVYIPEDGIMSFYSKISCENSYDYGRYYIDNIQKGSWSGNGNWGRHDYDITAGQHTFKWSYQKDGSVNSNDDCFYVDNISFISLTRGENRAANFYKVYRDECPESGMPALVADHVTDTCYLDTIWSTLEEGWYRYGVKACYLENDTTSLNESNMVWSNQILRTDIHAITVIVDPIEGGTITGAGEYVFGADCILAATPVENWTFLNWSENGEVVSTDSTYTFTVTTDRELLANFMPPLTITASAYPSGSGIITGDGVIGYGQTCTLTAIPNEGYSFCSWIENDSVVAYSPTYSFTVTGNRSLVANFGDCPNVVIGDGGTLTNTYLPSYSYFKYSLTQQIYTADEIGRNGLITSIALYNGGATKTRDYDIYMVNTDKTSFGSTTDWIAVTADDLDYSGSVTMEADTWTTIIFDTPFTYDGISNLALIVDDNSGNWTSSPHMACRVFDANGNQAIRIYSDNTNYDTNNPTQYSGTRLTVKNQIVLGFSISNTIETNISDEICYGDDYLQNGFEIYYPEVGENQYSITLPSSQNIDSIVNLTLTVHPTYYIVEDTTLCNATSFQWHGNTYTASGIYYDSLQTIHGCDSIYALSLEFFNTPLGEFAGMTPTNNYPFSSLPITFSWDAVSGAEYYNLYLWNVNEPVPSTPYAGNIYNRSCYVPSLQNHQTYQWYVEAVNICYTTESSIRSFSLNIPPTMYANTSSLNFGEVVLNASNTLGLYVSGNALDDTITLQITGEDASQFSVAPSANWNNLLGGSLSVTFSPTTVQYSYNANLVINSGTVSQTVHLSGSLADMFVFNTYVTQDVFEMNSTVPIYGTVTDVNNNPMAGAEVEVKVRVMGTTRSLFATTGDDGHFSVEFVPAYSESGYYTVNSGRVGHNSTAVHDDFNIPGMNLVTNSWILWDVVQNETTTGSIVIRNRSQIPLTNIQVTATNLPEGCAFTFQPLSLQGMEEGVLEYSVTGSALTSGNNYEEVRLVATSAEGATMNFSAWYYCAESRGMLYASPNAINTTMTRGISKIVDVMLYNNGTGPTGSVSIDLPAEEWLSVVGNDTLASIAVHDSAYFSLRLSANANTPLVQYTGNIAVNCERGDGLLLPFVITAVSDSTGTLVVDVTDDYTYNGNGEHLAGATVTVKGYYSLETVALGLTGSDGTFMVEDIPEGYYRMTITAPHHAEYQATILIEGGQTNTQDIYLQYQAITYSWNVVPTEIQDEYTFELIVEYETNVPVPVVVIDMPQTFPELEEGESYVFDYIITNYGLVDTYDATLYPPTGHPMYDFTPLITEIDTLHAQSTMVIPCTMTRRATQRSQRVMDALGDRGNREDDCPDVACTEIAAYYYCNGEQKPYTSLSCRNVGSHPCSTPPSNGGGGGGQVPSGGGHGGGGHGGSSGSSGSSTPPVTTQQQGCNDNPCQTNAMDELNSCPPQSDNTPKLPPVQPGNNR